MPKAKDNNNIKKEKKHFFKDLRAELKKVIWPTPKQLVNNTVAVITIVLITAVLVFALDFIFEGINIYGIDKIKSTIQSNNEIDSTNTETTNSEETNTIDTNTTEDTKTENTQDTQNNEVVDNNEIIEPEHDENVVVE